jgi:hypothetical protein
MIEHKVCKRHLWLIVWGNRTRLESLRWPLLRLALLWRLSFCNHVSFLVLFATQNLPCMLVEIIMGPDVH